MENKIVEPIKCSQRNIKAIRELEIFEEIDFAWASFLQTEYKIENDLFFYLCLILSHLSISRGYICCELVDYCEKTYPNKDSRLEKLGSFTKCKEVLNAIEMQEIVGRKGENKPIIFENDQLYLHKSFTYQSIIGEKIKVRFNDKSKVNDLEKEKISKELDDLLFRDKNNVNEEQDKACTLGLNKRIAIISGGPGTGKTTTVFRIVVNLLINDLLEKIDKEDLQGFEIKLLAPTGKASARISESLEGTKKQVLEEYFSKEKGSKALNDIVAKYELTKKRKDFKDILKNKIETIKTKALTVHSFLSQRIISNPFKKEESKKEKIDVVVIDEVSMLSFRIFSSLLIGIKDLSDMILVGDKDQLPSIEAGALLYDLTHFCKNKRFSQEYLLKDNIVFLEKNYRVEQASKMLAKVSQYVKNGESQQFFNLLKEEEKASLKLKEINEDFKQDLEKEIILHYKALFKKVERKEKIEDIINFAKKMIILTSHKQSQWGSEVINKIIENILKKNAIILSKKDSYGFYEGRPLFITKNNYEYDLFNGDVGIVLKNEEKQEFQVFFEGNKIISPLRIIDYQTAYAMTIHKSQGSEFEKVIMILSPEDKRGLIDRELIYTGITRAKKECIIFANKSKLKEAIDEKRMVRTSGLRRLLMKGKE